MKNMNFILGLLLVGFFYSKVTAQDFPNDHRFCLHLGIRNIVFDGSTGPVLGLSLEAKNNDRFSYNFLFSPCISIGAKEFNSYDNDKYAISDFQIRYSLSAQYRIIEKKNQSISADAGLCFVRHDLSANTIIFKEKGYPAISSAIRYQLHRLVIETRYDWPMSHKEAANATPFSVALLYTLNP